MASSTGILSVTPPDTVYDQKIKIVITISDGY